MAKRKFKKPSAERIQQRAERSDSKFDGIFKGNVNTYVMKQGVNTFRILPTQDDYWATIVWVHSFVGQKNGSYLCPELNGKSEKGSCPICASAEEAAKAGEKEEAQQLKARERALCWVIDREDERTGPKVLDMSAATDRDLAAAVTIKKGGKIVNILDITDPEEGFDINIHRRGQRLNTRYFGLNVDREASPLSEKQSRADKWLDYVEQNSILDLLEWKTLDYLEAVMQGTATDDDEDEDKKTKSKRRSKDDDDDDDERPRSRRRSKDEDEDDDDDDHEEAEAKRWKKSEKEKEEEDEDEDEDKKTKSKRRSKEDEDDGPPWKDKKKSKRHSKEDEEDDEDEDEDAKPRRSRKSKEDEEDDEDEDEDKKTKSKRRSKDDDDDDDDDDEQPRSRRRSKEDDDDDDDDDEDNGRARRRRK